jgi:hypothetical protein
VKRARVLAPLLVLLAACSGKGNTGRTEIDPALVAQVPWVNGAPPLIDPATKAAIIPGSPVYPPIKANEPDLGSRVVFDTPEHIEQACAPLAGITLSQWHHDFEPTAPGFIGVAPFFSTYDDKTEGSWHVPGDAAWYGDIAAKRDPLLWGLAADQIQNGPSCDGAPNDWALHIRGGRFNYYGGGAEHPIELDCSVAHQQGDICDHVVEVVRDGRTDRAVDASQFDGVAFWARRGPDGGSGLMVTLQDKYTSDRLARSVELVPGMPSPGVGYCQRIKQCYPSCSDGASCTPVRFGADAADVYRCIPEGARPQDSLMEPALLQQLYPPCGQSTCKPPTYDPDFDYEGTQCKPYNFTGLEENNWCFGDQPPAPPDERCGDGFAANISLSTDWQFFKLPFDRFQQIGFAKKAPPTDVPQKTLYSISFLFSVGYTDFYVDNLSFYRN